VQRLLHAAKSVQYCSHSHHAAIAVCGKNTGRVIIAFQSNNGPKQNILSVARQHYSCNIALRKQHFVLHLLMCSIDRAM
jgi:hypothetical protein